ncbi:hypothetical protein NE865_11021 [Phthorimaea operculella]|nr:hypothetical protein NE865_11021 [Phthorimaea operculella]
MEHVSTFILLIIALLQLCRAEVTGPWFAANAINDGDFSPKPLSEIFSTEPPRPFSSKNPIVVAQSTTPSAPISTSSQPGSSSSYPPSSISQDFLSTYSTPPPSTYQTQSNYLTSSLPPQYNQPTSPEGKPMFDLGPNQNYGLEPQLYPFQFKQDKYNQNNLNDYIVYQQGDNLPPSALQQTYSTFQPDVSSPQSTYSTFQPEVSSPQSTFSTFQPEVSSPQSTFSTFQPEVSSPQSTFSTSAPPVSSTPFFTSLSTESELSSVQSTFSTPRQQPSTTPTTIIFTPSSESTSPTYVPSPRPSSPRSTQRRKAVKATSRTVVFCNDTVSGKPGLFDKYPSLRIRMVAPSGSITNVNINPATTTKHPMTKRTTTRKPTTPRTRRTKKSRNTFNGCINTCEDRGRNPICAAPLAQIPVNPETLKGFPSVCHMACHNSFKKDQYEMIVQGRCGKLRTRIKTVDSDKLKRVELNKAQYTVVHGDEAVFEFANLPRNKF